MCLCVLVWEHKVYHLQYHPGIRTCTPIFQVTDSYIVSYSLVVLLHRFVFTTVSVDATGMQVDSSARKVHAPIGAPIVRRPPTADDPCAVCFEPMSSDAQSLLTYCDTGCGYPFHTACLAKWFAVRDATGPRTCPRCRSVWTHSLSDSNHTTTEAGVGAAATSSDEGYLNLAALQPGVRTTRDTSQYSEWLEFHQRRRGRDGNE